MLSTIPPSLSIFYWSWWWDSNSQPIDYKSIALPLRHISKYNSNNRYWLVSSGSRFTVRYIFFSATSLYPALSSPDGNLCCWIWKRASRYVLPVTSIRSKTLDWWCLSLDSNQLSMAYEAIAYPHKLHRQIIGIDYSVQLPKTFARRKL